jgi:rubredoxin
MKEYLRCKACGYIMDKDGGHEICPACGVSKKVFEDYKYNLSPRRKLIMDLDLHPIMLHFPQAITVFIPFFGILSLITDAGWGIKFLYSIEIITYLLPLTVIATIITGMIDGKNRFKKLGTPAIKKKIILGTILLVITSIMPCLIFSMGIKEALFPIMGLSIIAMVNEALLSKIGIKLISAYLPG